jgi:hypothetical protein
MKNSTTRPKIILGLVIFGVVSIIMIMFALFQGGGIINQPAQPKEATYTDPYSGETITETEGKGSEEYNNENSIVYFGFARLLEYGMTQDQIEILQNYLLQYSFVRQAKGESDLNEVTVDFKTYTQAIDENTSEKTVTFDLIANRDETQRYYIVNKSPTITTMWTDIYTADRTTLVFNAERDSFSD